MGCDYISDLEDGVTIFLQNFDIHLQDHNLFLVYSAGDDYQHLLGDVKP
jgi:hypothetical protein